MASVESKILCRSLGELGGPGARLVARFLPDVWHEQRIEINEPFESALKRALAALRGVGTPIPEFPIRPEEGTVSLLLGSGALKLNPTVVHINIERHGPLTSVLIRAVAKEGIVKQYSARKAVESITSMLCDVAT